MTEYNFAMLLVPLWYQSPQYEVAGKIIYKTLRFCRVWLYAGFSVHCSLHGSTFTKITISISLLKQCLHSICMQIEVLLNPKS